MNPNGFNPDQNPFEAILSQQGGGAPPGGGAMPPEAMMEAMASKSGGAPMGGGASPIALRSGMAGQEQPIMGPDEIQPGKTGDNTKPLLMAIQALHNYIASSSDQGTIQLVRNLISALTQLIARDQKAGEGLAQQQNTQIQQGGQGPTPGV